MTTDETIKEITDAIGKMTNEELMEELAKLRQRQQAQMEAMKDKPFTCDKCKSAISPGNAVFDVAISYQTMPDNPNDLDFDPQYEEYLCSECALAVIGLPGWPPKEAL